MVIYLNLINNQIWYKVEGTEDVCVIKDSDKNSILKFKKLLQQKDTEVTLVFRSMKISELICDKVEVKKMIEDYVNLKGVLLEGNPFEPFAGMLLETGDLIPDKVQRAASTCNIARTCIYVQVEGNTIYYKFNKSRDVHTARNPLERHDFYMSLAGHASDSEVHIIHATRKSYVNFLGIGLNELHSNRFVTMHTVIIYPLDIFDNFLPKNI
jgi:hypothetical protein